MKGKLVAYILFVLFTLQTGFSQVVDLTSYLPKGYSIKGNVDYTQYLQKGINENKNVLIPNFPILINEEGLNLKNNQKIDFQKNSKLIMKPNNKERYGLLNLKNVENIVINTPILEGDKDKHKSNSGEWGMGINILSSKNVKIINPYITKCWGDGIYIGEIHHTERKNFSIKNSFSKDILIRGGVLDGNRRNGISIINVKGLIIENITIKNTSGTAPMAGICIEPNGNEQFIEDIVLSGIHTKDNSGFGIAYVPSRYFGNRKKNVSIVLSNSVIEGSKQGLYLGGATAKATKNKKNIKKFEGQININNCKIYSCEIPIKSGSNQRYNPYIRIQGVNVYRDKKNRDLQKEKKIRQDLSRLGIDID